MNERTNLVLKIGVESGSSTTRLLRALEALGGPYQVLRPPVQDEAPALRKSRKSAATAVNFIYYGLPQAYRSGKVQEVAINRAAATGPAREPAELQKRLEKAGIPASLSPSALSASSGKTSYFRRYLVSVFHLRALEAALLVQPERPLPLSGEQLDRQSPLWKRLERTAVRALYAIGLDMGEVVILAGEEGQFTVEGISFSPGVPDEKTANRYARAIRENMSELDPVGAGGEKALIGMDPEFLLFDRNTGKVVPASRYLAHHGEAGCDVLRYRGRRMFPLAELRPAPGSEPREVVQHLLHAFEAARVSIPDGELLWQAGAMPQRGFPLGGHLHFSGVPLTGELLRTLDNYLALPVAVLEEQRSFRRRPRYGFLGDFRLQSHGGFEYRTLPSFLISPLVTKGVVALARLITENSEEFTARPLEKDAIFCAFYAGRQQRLRDVLPPLLADIEAAASYPRYKSYIAPFLEAVRSGRTWDESSDIRKRWKIQNPS